MKKKYIIPEMETVNIKTQQMLAQSVSMYGKDATGEGLAPEFDIWDEE